MLAQASGTILMISSMAGVYGFGGEWCRIRLLHDKVCPGRVCASLWIGNCAQVVSRLASSALAA
jgi:hypothetical protein